MTGKQYRKMVRITYIVLAVCLCLHVSALAQTENNAARPERGVNPLGSYAVSDIESISLTNGNLNLSIPLASLPPIAGGKLSWGVRAIYNSKMWDLIREEIDPGSNAACRHRHEQHHRGCDDKLRGEPGDGDRSGLEDQEQHD